MKKGLSLLLAASMTISAFSTAFAAEPLTTEEKYQQLVEANIFDGFPDGQAHLDEPMTRAQAAKVITLILGLEEDPAAASVYTDLAGAEWAAGYIGAATKAGILEGRGNGIFDPSANVSIQELAKILVEALDIEVDEDATVDGADDWAAPYVAAAVAHGLIPAQSDYTVAASRSILVEGSYAAYQQVQAGAELTVKAEVIGAAKVKLTLSKEVDSITVKRGNVAVNIADTIYSEDGKTATLEFANDLAEGTYTVTVAADEETAETTFAVEEEKVAAIEFSGYAVLDPDDDTLVRAYMKVTNQYGEDITDEFDKADFEWDIKDVDESDIDFDPDTGIVLLPNEDGEDWDEGDFISVEVVYEDDDVEVEVDTELEIVEPSRVSGIEILRLYHEDENDGTFSFDDDYEDWHLVILAVDQYGHEIYSDDFGLALLNDDIRIDVDDEDIFRIDEYDKNNPEDTGFHELEIDGEKYTVIDFLPPKDLDDKKAGEATVTLRAKRGAVAEITVTITDEIRVDTIQLFRPSEAVAGTKVVIPYKAIDLEGNEVTDPDVLDIYDAETNDDGGLNDISWEVDGIAGGEDLIEVKFEKNPKTGEADLILDLTDKNFVRAVRDLDDDDEVEIEITIETFTENEETITIIVDEAQEPDGISDVDIDAGYLVNDSATLEYDDITYVDQAGNELDADDIINSDDEYRVLVESSNQSTISVDGGKSNYITNSHKSVRLQAGSKKGTATLKLTLQQYDDGKWKNVGNASYSKKLRVVEKEDIKSYTASVTDWVYAEPDIDVLTSDYSGEIEVKGILDNGDEVTIPYAGGANFQATVGKKGMAIGVNGDGDPVVYVADIAALNLDEDGETIKVPVTIVVKGDKDTETLVPEATVSNEPPETAKLELDGDDVKGVFEIRDGVLYIEEDDIDNSSYAAAFASLERIINQAVKAEDQYGVELTEGPGFYTITTHNFDGDLDDDETLTTLNDGDSFDVTIVSNDSGKVLKFKVVIEGQGDLD